MSDLRRQRDGSHVLSLLLVEGPTEAIFYGRVKRLLLDHSCSVRIEHIEGLFNINKKVLQALKTRHTKRLIRAYCCLDRESRYSKTPDFDLEFIRKQVTARGMFNVLSVDAIIATQMIESWFFYDVKGIYSFLRVPQHERRVRTFSPPEGFNVSDLKHLFHRYGKTYHEGTRARHFIGSLSVEAIVAGCQVLRNGIRLVLDQAGGT